MKNYILFIMIFIFCDAYSQKNNFDFIDYKYRPHRHYRFTIFDRKFIDQSMRWEPYTGNATGYTNPLR